MTNRFMPEDASGREVILKAHSCETIAAGAGAGNFLVLNQTGKTIRLVAFNAIASTANAGATADVRNATGSMLSATADISVAATADAGVLHASNLTVASGGTVTFRFTNPAGGGAVNMVDAQATATFTTIP